MRNKRGRRRLALRFAALCFVLALLCGCLLPVFAEGEVLADSLPEQTWEDEPELPAEGSLPEPDEPEEPAGSETPDGSDEPNEPELFPEDDEEKPEEPKIPELPAESGEPDAAPGVDEPAEEQRYETVYFFWLSEKDEAEGGLPYAEQTVGSGEKLLMPEEPEADGKQFRYWYSRDDEGAAVRFVPPEEALWPRQDGEYSLYAYFTAEDAEEAADPADPGETDIPPLSETETEEEPQPEEEEPLPETEEAEEEATENVTEEDTLLDTEETTDDVELLAGRWDEQAAVFLLKTPTCLPGSNDPSQWAPDNSECRWLGQVNTYRAAWSDGGKNILSSVQDYIVSWPGGSTDSVWTLKPGDSYWNDVLNEIWDEYKESIEEETGITGLKQSDLEAITVTPYKISRNNGTNPDKHIDCTISVRSKKSFTARFNVRAPGEDDYNIVDSHEYQTGQRVQETGASIDKIISIGGVLYKFDGWYKEDSGPVTDEPGEEKVTQGEWDEGYLPDDDELENGVVNFYAHYVLAEVQPDTGVTLSFFAMPLLLCAGAAGVCCHKTKKEEDE